MTGSRRDRLAALCRDPAPLLRHLEGHAGGRLGLYFETLWHFFLRHDDEFELLAHNLPVREGGRTVGEFDCLCRARVPGHAVHLELAVKFYLGYRGGWLGPDARDSLDRKLTRLAEHQLQLADTPAARSALAGLGIESPLRRVAVRGRLFTAHSGLGGKAASTGAGEPGWWKAGPQPAVAGDTPRAARYALLGRELWFSPVTPADRVEPLTPDQLQERLQGQLEPGARPLQVAELATDGLETARFFVTPEGWPNPA